MQVSIIGLGFVGGAILQSFSDKKINVYGYDKYKNIGTIDKCLNTELCFLCLPTLYNDNTKEYDKTAIHETCEYLSINNYAGQIILKSTVEIGCTNNLESRYSNLRFVHNPEFLSAKTAYIDFHNQSHIVIGISNTDNYYPNTGIINFYNMYYPNAKLSVCTTNESEAMKLFCNSFYATKIQFFNEIYQVCDKSNISYDNVKDLMLQNNWINPMHTKVPGTDGKLSYGGPCFVKDTKALMSIMNKLNTPSKVLGAVINERDEMRNLNT